MDRIIRNINRIIPISIYLIILALCFFLIWRKDKYRHTLKNNWKKILLNTLIVFIISSIGFYIFFSIEDFIYDYDYAGNWIRNLTLRQMFFEEPQNLLSFVNNSLNNDIYSYLPAFLSLPVIIINNSFGFYCYGTFLFYIIPIFVVFQILYFTYFNKYQYLPILILLSFVILYISIFDGEAEVSGMLPLLMCYVLTIFPDFEEIDYLDNIFVNLFSFLSIFIRRFYLYAIVVYYVCYFIKYLKYYDFKIFNKNALLSFIKLLTSGLILLVVVLVFYPDFFYRAIYGGYGEEYAFNDHSGKLAYFITCISPIICLVSLFGIYAYYKEKKNIIMILILLISIFLPAVLFWRVQSFELHHYFITLIGIIIFYTYGLYNIFELKTKIPAIILSIFLLIQTSCVFLLNKNPIMFVGINRQPKVLKTINEYQDFMYYLIRNCGTGEESKGVYFATGDTAINSDRIKNSILPNLNSPNILTNVFDIRDGFPIYIKYASYVITSDPTLYLRKDYQHIYDIITYAIENEECISSLYRLKDILTIEDKEFKVYERISDYTKEALEYFYNEVIKIYPDKKDLFKNILD